MRRWLASALALMLSGLVAAQPIPFKHDDGAAAAALPGGAIGVLLLSALAIVAVLVVRKRLNLHSGGKAAPRHLKVLETQRLGPRTLLAVVEFGGQQHLIAQGEHGVNCLATAAATVPPDAAGGNGEAP